MNERMIDDEPPVTAADALAIIEREQARTEPDFGPFFVLWGAAWLAIGVAWFGSGQGVWAPSVAGIATAAVIVSASAASAVRGLRMGKGVSGPSQQFGALFGWSWTIAMVFTGVLVGGLARFGGPGVAVLAPALFVFVVGALYTLGGAVWRSLPDYSLGIVLQAVAAVSVFTPVPWNSLVMGVVGGGALAGAGIHHSLRYRAAR